MPTVPPKSRMMKDARPQLEAYEVTLREHLLKQMREVVDQQRSCALIELIIDVLDENGYLEEPLKDIYARLPE